MSPQWIATLVLALSCLAFTQARSQESSRRLLGSLDPKTAYGLRNCGGVSVHQGCPWLSAPFACPSQSWDLVIFVGASNGVLYAVGYKGSEAQVLDRVRFNAPIFARPSGTSADDYSMDPTKVCQRLYVADESGEMRYFDTSEFIQGTPNPQFKELGALAAGGGVFSPITTVDRSQCDQQKCGNQCPPLNCKPAQNSGNKVVFVTAHDSIGGYMMSEKLDTVIATIDFYKCGGTTVFDCDALGNGVQGAIDLNGAYASIPSESSFHLIDTSKLNGRCGVDNACLRACPDPQPSRNAEGPPATGQPPNPTKSNAREGQAISWQPLEAVGEVRGAVIIEKFTAGAGTAYRSYQISSFTHGNDASNMTTTGKFQDPSYPGNREFGIISFGWGAPQVSLNPQCQQDDAWVYNTGATSYATPKRVTKPGGPGSDMLIVGTEDHKVHCVALDQNGYPACTPYWSQDWEQHDDPLSTGVEARVRFYNDTSSNGCRCNGWASPFDAKAKVRTTAGIVPVSGAFVAFVVSDDGTLHGINLDHGTEQCSAKMKAHSNADPFISENNGKYSIITSDDAGYVYVYDQNCDLQTSTLVNDPGPYQGSWVALGVTIPVCLCFLMAVGVLCKAHEPWKPKKQLDLDGNRVTSLNLSQVMPGLPQLTAGGIERQALLGPDPGLVETGQQPLPPPPRREF